MIDLFPVNISLIVLFFQYAFKILMYRLRDNLEELRRSLQPKEDTIGTLQNSVIEKEQVICVLLELG